MTTAIFKNGGNKCHRSQVIVYLKLESPDTYIGIPQLLLCMPYLLRYGDIEFGSHFEKWPSPRYAQFLKCSPSRILKPYVYITQINSQTSIPPKCLRAYRAGPGLTTRPIRIRRARVDIQHWHVWINKVGTGSPGCLPPSPSTAGNRHPLATPDIAGIKRYTTVTDAMPSAKLSTPQDGD